MKYYQFNIADYRQDTQHLTPEEHYIYRTLLDECYLTELPLPTDIRVLMRKLRLTSDQKDTLLTILDEFFDLTDEGYSNDKVNRVLSKTYEKSEKARASVKVRWDRYERKRNSNDRNTNVERSKNEGNTTNTNTNTIRNTSITTSGARARARGNGKFKPPTPDEAQAYIDERGIDSFTGQTFCDFYEARGWELSNGKKMKDWQAAVRTWENRRKDQQPPKYGEGGI